MTLSVFPFLVMSINLLLVMYFRLEHQRFRLTFFHEIAQLTDLSFVWSTGVGIGGLSKKGLIYCMNSRRIRATTVGEECIVPCHVSCRVVSCSYHQLQNTKTRSI